MSRSRYLMQRNESTQTPSLLVFFDTETVPVPIKDNPKAELHTLRLWCGTCVRVDKGRVTRRVQASGHDAESWWQWLYGRCCGLKPVWVFAHNLAFDLTTSLFWKELEEGRLTLKRPDNWRGVSSNRKVKAPTTGMLVLEDPPTIIEAWLASSRQRFVFCDTLNWFHSKLADLGAELGVPKLAMPEFSAPDDDWYLYCANDVLIIEKAMLEMMRIVRDNDLGVWKYTVSGQAMAAYKHRFMSHPIELHRIEEVVQLEREAYMGGEVRLGFYGDIVDEHEYYSPRPNQSGMPVRYGPVYVLDVQSFYPSIMRERQFPCRYVGRVVGPSPAQVSDKLAKYLCIARVYIKSDTHTYPVRRHGRSLVARGKFVTTLCGNELMAAWKRGHIWRVGCLAYYDSAQLFHDFVWAMYDLRLQAKRDNRPQTSLMYKLLMNSLAGKFGQRDAEWVNDKDSHPTCPFGQYWSMDDESGKMHAYRSIMWEAQKLREDTERGLHADSFPAIAAFVTSYGRSQMEYYRSILQGDEFIYQDTDSLHVTKEGYDRIKALGYIVEDAIGKLAVKRIAPTASYRGLKFYRLGEQWIIAGLKSNATQIDVDTWEQVEFQQLSSIIADRPLSGVIVKRVPFHTSDTTILGHVGRDGTVYPPEVYDE